MRMEKRSRQGTSKRISPTHAEYPVRLKRYLSRPQDIYIRGDLSVLQAKTVGIVGSRRCTAYGREIARRLAKEAAGRGLTVISGLARGIDTEAHRGTEESGWRTVAVLATGLDKVYPPENRGLQKRIEDKGLVLSEYPDGSPAKAFNFPVRNRIIAALSDALVVVEAGTRSGALITAEAAVEQGKLLYVVPGNITSPASFGTNKLLSEGADPLIRPEDLFLALGVSGRGEKEKREALSAEERALVNLVTERGEMTLESLALAAGYTIGSLNGLVTVLEMKGYLMCEMGRVLPSSALL